MRKRDMRLAARDMCARRLYCLITVTNSSSVINFTNEESAHAKYSDPCLNKHSAILDVATLYGHVDAKA